MNKDKISNQKFAFDPFSPSVALFENEINLKQIQYLKNDVSINRPRIEFIFYEKDIEIVYLIFDKINRDYFEQEEKRRKIKKQKKRTPEARQKKVAIYILILILIVILFSIIL